MLKSKHIVFTLFCITFFSLSILAKTIEIVTITEDFASIAKAIGGDKVNTTPLVKGSKNLHLINPKPSMVLKVKKADLLIRLGMKQDSWIDGLIHVAKNGHIFHSKSGYLDASDRIKKLEVPGENIDGRMGDVHIEGNPHYWLDPNNGIIIARQITDRLSTLSPENKDYFESNFTTFSNMIKSNMTQWKQRMEALSSTSYVTYHKVWSYFFKAFNLKLLGELEPVPGIPPTIGHLHKLKNVVEKTNDKIVVLNAKYYPKNNAIQFAKQVNGAHKVLPTNVTQGNIPSYVALFDTIITILEK